MNRGIEVIISQGPIYNVKIQTGENLIDNIEVTQNGNTLTFKDKTTCNWVREYGQTKILVTTPILEEVYSKSDRNISSNGILTFPSLRLLSIDSNGDFVKGAGTGDFYINVNNTDLYIESNNVSRFFVTGNCTNASFNFFVGDGRIEAQNLTAQNIYIYHRGSNDMIVKPIQSIAGRLVSTGNVIIKNNTPVNTLQALFTGQIIYN